MEKNVKAMLKISDVLDDRYKKLCDRYHDLKLSHNRKKRALKIVLDKVSWEKRHHNEFSLDWCFFSCLEDICINALFSDGRERSKK